MALDTETLKAAIESAFRSAEPGQDCVSDLAGALASAIEAFVKSGTVTTTTSGGGCVYSGPHPPLNATGQVT